MRINGETHYRSLDEALADSVARLKQTNPKGDGIVELMIRASVVEEMGSQPSRPLQIAFAQELVGAHWERRRTRENGVRMWRWFQIEAA